MTSSPKAAAASLLALTLTAGLATGQSRRANINLAEARFRLGEFAQAAEIAATVLEADAENLRAVMMQAELALLEDRLEDAETLAHRALELRPAHRLPTEILAAVQYRRGEFTAAAGSLAALGRETTAAKLMSFEGRRPYASNPAEGRIPFAASDPAPTFRVRVNGSPPALFALDTRAGEVGIDSDWAAEIGLADFGVEKSSGGRRVGHGRADTLTFEGFEIRDVPVTLLDASQRPTRGSGEPVRGVIGATLLSRFRATVDYPGSQLILEPRSREAAGRDDPDLLARIPFYFTIENDIVAPGQVNEGDPLLLLIALGDASRGFTSPRTTLDEAQVELLEKPSGASSAAIPFLLENLSLGELRRSHVPGVHGLFPPSLEHDRGFRIGGLIADGFLRPYAVTFDFDAMELLIRQPPG